jgi:two-component system chemotaxis response regulator CheB
MRPDGPIRVLIIDDSSVFARVLATELERRAGIHVWTVDGDQTRLRDHLVQHHPEVILLDLALRQSDPLRLLTRLRAYYPVPVIVSVPPGERNTARALQAIRRGALDVVRKPESSRPPVLQAYACDLARKISVAVSLARPVRPPLGPAGQPISFLAAGLDPAQYVVAVGASTGGTAAVETLLARAPADFPTVVIVQHMPVGFTRSFAARLNAASALSVGEAVDGELLHPGRAVVARGDTHLILRRAGAGWCVRYTDRELVNRHCPSVDVLFESLAAASGQHGVGVLLTGMGADGARGLLQIRQAGGTTIAQTKESCVVYGMPKVAVELGAAMFMAAPEDVPSLVLRALQKQPPAAELPLASRTRD